MDGRRHSPPSRHRQQANRTCRWEKLNLVRVYTKPKGKMPDYSSPVVLRANKCTIEDFVSLPLSLVYLETKVTQADQHSYNSVMPSIGPLLSSSRAPSSTASPSSTNRNESVSHTSSPTKTLVGHPIRNHHAHVAPFCILRPQSPVPIPTSHCPSVP